MSNEQLDLSLGENWNIKNAEAIALQFGYVLNPAFIEELESVCKFAQAAKVTIYLGIFAEKHFKEHTPPLERTENFKSYTLPPVNNSHTIMPQPAATSRNIFKRLLGIKKKN